MPMLHFENAVLPILGYHLLFLEIFGHLTKLWNVFSGNAT